MAFEIIKLLIIFLVPIALVYTSRHRAALVWLGAVTPLDALSANVVVRVTTLSAFGLASLPYVLHELKHRARALTKAECLVLLGAFLLFGGVVVYGFLFPWPDPTGERPINLAAPGRSVIFFTRFSGSVCAAMYIGYAVRRLGTASKVMLYLLVGTTIAAVGLLIHAATGQDLFMRLSNFTQIELLGTGRSRGFNYEPRCAAQWCVVGILLCMGITRLGRVRWPLLLIHVAGLAATLSTSGLLVLGVGAAAMATMTRRARGALVVLAGLFLAVVVLTSTVPSIGAYKDAYETVAALRLGRQSLTDPTPWEKFKDKLEVFDHAAVGFFEANPAYLVFGTGSGTISIPASDYARPYALAVLGGRIDEIPQGGLLQTVSNVGIVGLVVWLMLVNTCRRALLSLYKTTGLVDWHDAYVLFVTFSVYYLVMYREMWFLALGLGLGAAQIGQARCLKGGVTARSDGPAAGAP